MRNTSMKYYGQIIRFGMKKGGIRKKLKEIVQNFKGKNLSV